MENFCRHWLFRIGLQSNKLYTNIMLIYWVWLLYIYIVYYHESSYDGVADYQTAHSNLFNEAVYDNNGVCSARYKSPLEAEARSHLINLLNDKFKVVKHSATQFPFHKKFYFLRRLH